MSNPGFIARIANLWRGMFSGWIGRKEERNPEAVYESAINERLNQYEELKKAVSGIVYLRNKLAAELEDKSKELNSLQDQIMVAVDKGEDEAALVLIQKRDELNNEVERLKKEADQTSQEADEAKKSMQEFQAEINRLQREKDRAIARLATLEARKRVQRQLDRLSPEADVRALESVRERIQKLSAELDSARELHDKSLDDKLKEIRQESSLASARAQLEELKKSREEKKKEPGKVEKTI
ncbi:MAG: PspA/IM30 family protein [bacterium]